MRVDKTTAASKIQGFGYIGDPATASISVASFSLAAGATSNFSTTMAASVQDAASLTRIKFSGVGNTDINNQWVRLPGSMSFLTATYDVAAIIERTTTGQLITVQFHNPSGAPQTVPDITIDIKSYFYTAPW